MYIKIYTKSQLELLRSLEPVLREKYKIPDKILDMADKVLKNEELGRTGFIAILLDVIQNDVTEIQDVLNCYPHKLKIIGDIINVPVKEEHTWMTKDRDWYMDIWKIKKESSFIYIIYSMTLEILYGKQREDG